MERFTLAVTRWVGSVWAFNVALAFVLLWGLTGPIFGFSDTWQLVVNTLTTIVTFLMVFLLQRSQNKDTLAVQLKLNELVAAVKGASNRLIDVEDLSEDEIRKLHDRFKRLAVPCPTRPTPTAVTPSRRSPTTSRRRSRTPSGPNERELVFPKMRDDIPAAAVPVGPPG